MKLSFELPVSSARARNPLKEFTPPSLLSFLPLASRPAKDTAI